jgi:hypothetical protein
MIGSFSYWKDCSPQETVSFSFYFRKQKRNTIVGIEGFRNCHTGRIEVFLKV